MQQPDFIYIINCRSRISLKLQQNEINFAVRGEFMLVSFGPSSFLSFADILQGKTSEALEVLGKV